MSGSGCLTATGKFSSSEAANAVPRWLSPETDAHRTWIHGGDLRIIPATPATPNISLPQAVEFIRSSPDALVHSPSVQAEAFYRLQKYPGHISRSLHHALATIPESCPYILHTRPRAIAPAVRPFTSAIGVSLKALRSASEGLRLPPRDLVTVSVRFTKVLFAQLVSQRFGPPAAWASVFASARRGRRRGPRAQKTLSSLEIGMKVTCGFELLVSAAPERSDNRVAGEVGRTLND